MISLSVVSWTGYTIQIKPFMLLASVTCQDDGKIVLMISWKEVRVCGMYIIFCKKKNK
jgi:hypothetical protein